MNGGDILFDALNGVSDCFVLEAGDLLRIGEEKPHGRGKAKLWKTALLAAALALLLAAAAYAAGLLHWKDQTYSIEGTNRVIVVPNGLRGTKTYEGTAAWWTWVAAQRETWREPDWSFTRGDDALRKTCETYRATTPEAAAKLREIAETYGLELYSESFPLTGRDELYDRSGMQPYVKDGTDELQSGYIFPDGSFYAEGCLAFGETRLPVTLQRVSTGALYPFGFPAPAAEYTEREYRSALGQSVNLVLWENGRLEIWYLSEDGEMFAALRMYEFDRPTARRMPGSLQNFLPITSISPRSAKITAQRALLRKERVYPTTRTRRRGWKRFIRAALSARHGSFRASLRRIFTARASPACTGRAATRTSAQSSRSLRSGTTCGMRVPKRRTGTMPFTITARSTRNDPSRRQWAAENGSYITSPRTPCTPA